MSDYWSYSHEYDAKYDDYHLGLTTELPYDWFYQSKSDLELRKKKDLYLKCFECDNKILTEKYGVGKLWLNKSKFKVIQFCENCYKNHGYKNVNFRIIEFKQDS